MIFLAAGNALLIAWLVYYLVVWRRRALDAINIAQTYAGSYFKTGANPDCRMCGGQGVINDPEVPTRPCPYCFPRFR